MNQTVERLRYRGGTVKWELFGTSSGCEYITSFYRLAIGHSNLQSLRLELHPFTGLSPVDAKAGWFDLQPPPHGTLQYKPPKNFPLQPTEQQQHVTLPRASHEMVNVTRLKRIDQLAIFISSISILGIMSNRH